VQCAIAASARQTYGKDPAKNFSSTTIPDFPALNHSCKRVSMPKQHSYVLGLNTYDHDVSACLLRDGAIAFAIAKERITREKHATGFYKEVIDYCLDAEGIALDDVDLLCVDVKAGDAEVLFAEKQYQRQTNITQAYHTNFCGTVFQLDGQRIRGRRNVFQSAHDPLIGHFCCHSCWPYDHHAFNIKDVYCLDDMVRSALGSRLASAVQDCNILHTSCEK